MTTLKEILDSIEIDTSDLEGEDKKDEKEELDISKLPEEHQPIFKRLVETVEGLKTETAQKDLIITALKESMPKKEKPPEEKKSDKKVLGVLDSDDPYAPLFQELSESINTIKNNIEGNKEKDFKTNLIDFAKEHPDIARYANDMDRIAEDHPSLRNDIPKLYALAKTINQKGKEGIEKKTKNDQRRFSSERSGISDMHTRKPAEGVKSISDAFEIAEQNLAKGGNR